MICEEMIKQRLEGMKNYKGQEIGEAFPKLIYVLDEHNCLEGGKYDYITKLAAKCTAKRLVPDYQSAKIMRENYEDETFPPMGCRSHLSNWKDENGRMDLSIHGSGSADVTLLDFQEQDKVEVPLAYSIDKDAKTITFSYDDAKLKSVADKSKGAYSENDLETALESLASTYTYSVDRECLTLTESEYGDQMVLDKE